jgi:N-acetyl-alpha-D-muramate 1-phosphate uridylyltransferase
MLPIAILAGGLATRLGPITEHRPKALVEVAGRPFAAHQIELLRQHGVDDITFLVGYLGEMIQDELGDGSRWGVRLRYVFDGPVPLGTGGAIRRALPQIGGPFFVLYGDSYLECDYEAIARVSLAAREQGLMTVCRNEDRWDRSNVLFEHGRVVQYDKVRPSAGMRHIDYGLGVFRHEAFARWPEGQAFDLAAVYQALLADNDLAGFEVPSRFYEIGSPQGLEEARAYLSRKESPIR